MFEHGGQMNHFGFLVDSHVTTNKLEAQIVLMTVFWLKPSLVFFVCFSNKEPIELLGK